MEKLVINGGKSLRGSVEINGAKNAAVAILPAAIIANTGKCVIDNIPDIEDVHCLERILKSLGCTVNKLDNNTLEIDSTDVNNFDACTEDVRRMRASYYFIGSLLARFKQARVELPGGCPIGVRPIDQHIKGFEALGAEVVIEHGAVKVKADRLVGTNIFFDVVSVGATINVMIAATLAEGVTTLENVAKEPHVVDVANFLNTMGADIKGAGTDVIRIRGVKELSGCSYSVIPDQIEAGTFMISAAATRGDITIKNVIPKHLEAISVKLMEIGATVEEFDDAIRVTSDHRLGHTQIKTLPYPGFPTDMQPQIATLLALSDGTSIVTESIFENRFKYVDELSRMGASIKVEGGNVAIIEGVEGFTGAAISAPDLRAGAALVVAALVAEGYSTVDCIHYIERGYECFEDKLAALGGYIEKIPVDDERAVQKFKLKVG